MNVLLPKTEKEILELAKNDSYGTWLALKHIKNNETIGKYIHLIKTNLFRHFVWYYEYEYWEIKEFNNKTILIENSHSGKIKTIQYIHLLKSYRPFWIHHIEECINDLKDEELLLKEASKKIKKYNKSWAEKQ